MALTTASPDQAAAPTLGEHRALAEQTLAALRCWCTTLPTNEFELDANGTSTPQIELRTIIDDLDLALEALGDEARLAQAAVLLDRLEAALWRVSTFETPRISVEWCRRAASFAADILEEALRGGAAIGSTNVVTLPLRRPI